MQRVLVIGGGYVGLPLACAAANVGHEVTVVDRDPERVEALLRGDSPVEDVKREDLLRVCRFTGSIPDGGWDVAVICVPTPIDRDGQPDYAPLRDACRDVRCSVAGMYRSSQVVIVESTVGIGATRDDVATWLGSGLPVVYSPERIDPGRRQYLTVPKLVGGLSVKSVALAVEFYRGLGFDRLITVSSPEIAEAAKLWENTFRLVGCALAFEIEQILHGHGLDAREVFSAADTKPYGWLGFKPTIGVGGHCIAVDPYYLLDSRGKVSLDELPTISGAVNTVQERPAVMLERAIAAVQPNLRQPRVLLVGVSYKPGVADCRESPALKLADLFLDEGWTVAAFDPVVAARHAEVKTPDGSTLLLGRPSGRYDLAVVANPRLTWDRSIADTVIEF